MPATTEGSCASTPNCGRCSTRPTRSRRAYTATKAARALCSSRPSARSHRGRPGRAPVQPSIEQVLHEDTDRPHLRSTQQGYRDALGLPGPPRAHRRLPAGQPDRDRRPARRRASSALVANVAENAALDGYPVALFSLEMSESSSPSGSSPPSHASKARIFGAGRSPRTRWPKILEVCTGSARRRCTSMTPATPACLRCGANSGPAAPRARRQGGPGADHHRLPAADASRRPG